MVVEYLYLIPALIILWIPAFAPRVLVKESSRKTMVHRHASHSEPLLRHFSYWGNWINALKGFAGAWLLWNGAFTVDQKSSGATLIETACLNAPPLLALLPQMFRIFKGRLVLFSPTMFFSGFLLGSGDPLSGCFAVLAAWIFTAAAQDSRMLLPTMALALGSSIYLINGIDLPSLVRAPVLLTPLMISIFLQKPLIEIRAPHKLPVKI